MLSLGFAHKPALAAAPAVLLDESYRLPDGTFAEICLGHSGGVNASHPNDGPAHSSDAILFCEACLLASSILAGARCGRLAEDGIRLARQSPDRGMALSLGPDDPQTVRTRPTIPVRLISSFHRIIAAGWRHGATARANGAAVARTNK